MELRVPHGLHLDLVLFEMSRGDHVLHYVFDFWVGSLEAQVQFVCVFKSFALLSLNPLAFNPLQRDHG